MDTIFTLGDLTGDNVKINMDDLYEKKKQHDLNTVNTYTKILGRIHNKIKTLSRQQKNDQHCWYVIPEVIIGVPKYDHSECTAYIIDKLRENGFMVRYTHPNLVFISWKHWIPGYVRSEIKKKTGNIIDGYGNKISKKDNNNEDINNPDELMFQKSKNNIQIESNNNKEFTDINTYQPSGNLIYNKDLLKRIEDKTKN